MRPRISIRGCVRWSVCLSVGHAFVKTAKNGRIHRESWLSPREYHKSRFRINQWIMYSVNHWLKSFIYEPGRIVGLVFIGLGRHCLIIFGPMQLKFMTFGKDLLNESNPIFLVLTVSHLAIRTHLCILRLMEPTPQQPTECERLLTKRFIKNNIILIQAS